MTFRDATLADGDAIAELHTASWRRFYRGILPDVYLDGPVPEERRRVWTDRLSNTRQDRQRVHIALDGSIPVGFTCVLADEEPEPGILLDNLHVLESHQGLGIGRQLFRKSVHWANQLEPGRPMHLWVFEANRQAMQFYNALRGKMVDRQLKRIAGVDVPSVCYVWEDLGKMVVD